MENTVNATETADPWATFGAQVAAWRKAAQQAQPDDTWDTIGPLCLPTLDLLWLDTYCQLEHGIEVLEMTRSPQWLEAWRGIHAWGTHWGICRPGDYAVSAEEESYLERMPSWFLRVRLCKEEHTNGR